VVIALAGPAGTVTEEHIFPGSRVDVMVQISERALTLLRDTLASSA
jgi:hypothetical protein